MTYIKELATPDVNGCRYSCEGCYFLSEGLQEITEHIRVIHAPREFQCPYCKKMYYNKSSHKAHISKMHRDLHAQVAMSKKYSM